ncbi:MAG: LAGLIDADG family homing endonuclease [Candidatus Niyogibacteria bacterium]|nr:LAGLIDADG family homing endonuclease [Candidatus Niyogibacteria bacterium]
MKANAVGKIYIEADRAYLAGLIDGEGAIMATIERHSEKKFGWRVRVEVKITQKEAVILRFLCRKYHVGKVNVNRTAYDWMVRDQQDVRMILDLISPYSLAKKRQIQLAMKILNIRVESKAKLVFVARLADTLSGHNVRSKNRRKNYATMIKI